MLKINSHHLFLLTALFCVNSANVRVFSFNTGDSNVPLFPTYSSITPQFNNWSTDTFMPIYRAGNNSTEVIAVDSHLVNHITDYKNKNRNYIPMLTSHEPNSSNVTNSSGNINNTSISSHMQQQRVIHLPTELDSNDFDPNTNTHNVSFVPSHTHTNVTPQSNNLALVNINNVSHAMTQSNGNTQSKISQFPIERTVTTQLNNWSSNIIPSFMSAHLANNSTNPSMNLSAYITVENGDSNIVNINNKNVLLPITDNLIPSTTSTTNNKSLSPVATHTKKAETDDDGDYELLGKNNRANKKKSTKKYTCSQCGAMLTSKRNLRDHVRIHDPNREKLFKCTFKDCNKRFSYKSTLQTHNRIHTGEKPFLCQYCNKSFRTLSQKNVHERIHTKEKRFKCDFKGCSKRFNTNYEKNVHHRVHTGEKPFKCHICQKGLKSKGVLNDHLNKHLGKKPYKCGQCTKAYATDSGLRSHLKRHNRPKPYTCQYCGDAFTSKTEHKNHMRYEKSTDEDRKCHICKRVYADKYNLAEHNKKKHSRLFESPSINS